MAAHGDVLVTSLTKVLSVRHPVLLAPMGGAAGGRLAAAVSGAGAMGVIGGGYADPRWLEVELAAAGDARVGVGFITFALDDRSDALRVALEAQPALIQLSFGDPRPYAEAIHAAGARLVCQVQSRAEMDLAVAAGSDVIVVQGRDGGGHGRPDRGTAALVPSAVDRLAPIPVVAAGGIADGRGLAGMLALGASGVVMGTRFLAAREAISSPGEAALLIGRGAEDTVRTSAFDRIRGPAWPAGYDGRALRNDLTGAFERGVDEEELHVAYRRSALDDHAIRPVWAGEGLDLIESVETAADIVTATVGQAIDTIVGLATLVETVQVTDRSARHLGSTSASAVNRGEVPL